MANGQISKLLEFASMQMAAEAFFSQFADATLNKPPVLRIYSIPGRRLTRPCEADYARPSATAP
jgi:hypothetical protein